MWRGASGCSQDLIFFSRIKSYQSLATTTASWVSYTQKLLACEAEQQSLYNVSAIAMALSLSFFLVCLLTLLPKGLRAATVTHDLDVGWVRANPDGMFERPVIGINGQWPPPLLNFTKGDRVIINLHNSVSVGSILSR